MKKLYTLLSLVLLFSCASKKVHKEYDKFSGESVVKSGHITFTGWSTGGSLFFVQKKKVDSKIHAHFTISSIDLEDLTSNSKIGFLLNNANRVTSTCKNYDKSCFTGPYGFRECSSSCDYSIKKTDIYKLANAKSISFRVYLKHDKTKDLDLDDKDIAIIKEFAQEIG